MPENFRCTLLHLPVREEPAHRSQMVTQLLFGELFQILESRPNHWHHIRCTHDGYEGFVFTRYLSEASEDYSKEAVRVSSQYATIRIGDQRVLVSYGSRVLENELISTADVQNVGDDAVAEAGKFIHTPYLWGGRSIWGIDCSGLVQQVFNTLGVALRRDAWQQAERGEAVNGLEHARAGDVAFFTEGGSRITHTGILTGRGTIIHASEWVREDRIDEQGIFNTALQAYTHQASIIRRYL